MKVFIKVLVKVFIWIAYYSGLFGVIHYAKRKVKEMEVDNGPSFVYDFLKGMCTSSKLFIGIVAVYEVTCEVLIEFLKSN